MNFGVILAGGKGIRAGFDIPKQFVEVLGKPIIAYTLDIFQNNPEIDYIEVVCIKEYIGKLKDIVKKYNLNKVKYIVEGGKDFQESVLKGVEGLKNIASANDNLVIHFAASPFINDEIISDSIRVCNLHGNAISTTDYYVLSGVKKYNSSVNDPKNYTDEYIPRDSIAVMNTPHTFRYSFIQTFYTEAIEKGIIDTVEPHTTTLMYKMKLPIYFSKGSQLNIKITKKEDIDLFEGYVLFKNKNNI